MPTPRRFNQDDISEIWLELCTDTTSSIASRRGVTPSAIQHIGKGKSYKLETALTDGAIVVRARAAMLDRQSGSVTTLRNKKREAPTRETLQTMLNDLGTQRAVALALNCSVGLVRDWMIDRKLSTGDYTCRYRNHARLEASDIPLIRQLHAEGQTIGDIAVTFDVLPLTIGNVLTGKNWSEVK